MMTVQPGDGLVKADLIAKGPSATDAVVLREWDGPQGRMQECQVDPPHGLRFKRKANQMPVPRSKPLPGQKPPQGRQQVRLVTRVVAADAAVALRPALAPLTKNAGAEPAAASPAAMQLQLPAASGASETQVPAALPPPAEHRAPPQQQQQDVQMAEAADGGAEAGADAAAPAQSPTAAPAAQPEAAASAPAAAATATAPVAAAAAEAAETAAAATQAAGPAAMVTAPYTAAAKPQAVAPAVAAEGAGADMAAVASRSGFTHEEIHAVLDQLPDGTPEERQAAQAAVLAQTELEAAIASLRPPANGAVAGEGGGEADAAGEPASAEAAVDAEVAAALAALLPDFLAAAPQIMAPEAPVAAALAAAHKRQQEAAEAGDGNGAGFGFMTPGRLAAEKQALRAREAALKEELAQWEALQQQAAVLSPERPPAPDAAAGPLDDAAAESAAVAAARAEAHQQLTLQVEGLCWMVEGVTALLARADATTSQLQAAYEAAAFGSLPHVDSPATLVRRAIRPLPPPPTPAVERAAREA